MLTTTVQVLGEVGYGALRIDEVAARSGVNKTTIYRRWPTKSQLVTAALRQHYVPVSARDTGDLEHDITSMFVESLSTADLRLTRGLMRMTLLEGQDPEVAAIKGELHERSMAARRSRFELAIERGELPPATNIMLLVNLLSSTIYVRLLALGEAPAPDVVADLVGIVVAGARVRWAGVQASATKMSATKASATKVSATKATANKSRKRG